VEGPVREAARAAAPPDTEVLVGGVTSALADLREANNRDLSVVFPVAGLLVALVLAFLLRSVVAPVYLMLAVVLGFLASLGATVLGYQVPTGAPGLAFAIPIVTYLFVTAIGTDYNILMISRLREEVVDGADPRRAAAMAVEHTGPSVAAAGLILAGAFASLLLAGVGQLTQIGFAVSIGIVLAAFVMALLLVPALSALLGTRVWWPGHTVPPDGGISSDESATALGPGTGSATPDEPEPELVGTAGGGR
jgi:putative drug exporter of the RND superfamily